MVAVRKRLEAWVAAIALGLLAVGCGGGGDQVAAGSDSVVLRGTVTYTRIPLLRDAAGVPLGLETDSNKFVSKPARSVVLRVYQGQEETLADGTKTVTWQITAAGPTDRDGRYALTVKPNKPTFVELVSTLQYLDAQSKVHSVRLLANPDGIGSSLPLLERPLYGLRKKLDGSEPSAITVPGQVSAITAETTVNFEVGVNTRWLWVPTQPTAEAPSTPEPGSTGSRVLAILDDGFEVASTIGSPTPGSTLNLHYCPGVSEAKGTYVEYDRSVFPASFDGASLNYLGSIRGGASNDDAWDQAVTFRLFARNRLYASRQEQYPVMPFPVPPLADGSNLQGLAPDLAVLEGFAQGIAALLLKNPYLADTHAGGVTVTNVANPSPGLGSDPYSAANLAALFWNVALKANNVTAPGDPNTWKNLDPSVVRRFWMWSFTGSDGTNSFADIPNVWLQLARLKEPKTATETVDLASIFTDAVLTTLATNHGIAWPRPTTGPEARFLQSWPKNPDLGANTIPAYTLSMAGARLDGSGAYPNHSKGEVVYGRFELDQDRIYELSVASSPALPAGAEVEVHLGTQVFRFGAGSGPVRIPLSGSASSAVTYPVRMRLLSPTALQPDLAVTLRMAPQN